MTIQAKRAGLDPIYHDLSCSKTADFATLRFARRFKTMPKKALTWDWNSNSTLKALTGLDAVVAYDFFEHLMNVEEWVDTVYEILRPGGVMLAQNAFGIGSGENGSIPCHLAINDRFEQDWVPLLLKTGFSQIGTSNWWLKPNK